ncbi:hypothetical protein [Flavobacterium sp. DSP2-3-1]|uniref:hypothetical protein n=1 Tax=Flavobacterium sp. DSP2-3-1 TaxID=2804620 RepID=UPI003CFA675C
MKKNTLLLILVTFCLFSCNQNSKSTLEKIEQSEKTSDKNVYTKYKYTNSEGGSIAIENSLPKGGMKYIDIKGEIYNYVVFWTRIMNQTDNTIELNINFPLNSYEVPSLTGKYYEILIPSDTMTIEKSPLYLYGLSNFETFLNNNIHKESNLKRTINSKESTGFYVVMLCLSEGAHGTMRTELNVKEENLFYRVKVDGSNTNNKSSDRQIRCGNINLKNLILQK